MVRFGEAREAGKRGNIMPLRMRAEMRRRGVVTEVCGWGLRIGTG